jgi:hypothetical protein
MLVCEPDELGVERAHPELALGWLRWMTPCWRGCRSGIRSGVGESGLSGVARGGMNEGEAASNRRTRENSSPYATGGGGVTLERRVGAVYLARLLTGDAVPELGDGREVRSVAFQQAQRVAVDDLVIEAARPHETDPSVELGIGIRRRPNLIRSNEDSQKLITEYLRVLASTADDGREHRLALAVGGRQPHAEQLAELAALARNQSDAASFFFLVVRPTYRQQLVGRLDQLAGLVEIALPALGVAAPDIDTVRQRTWELLRSLWVLMLSVEEPDTSDWAGTQSRLVTVAHGGDLVGAGHLLDRLEVLAGQYAPSAARVDRSLLGRDVHALLDDTRGRTQQARQLVEHLQRQARAAVGDHIGRAGTEGSLHLDRDADGEAVIAAASAADALIVGGESGVGKSALVLGAAASAAEESGGDMQVVCLNLRHLPESSFDLVSRLGCPLEVLLGEMSAPLRVLVVDGADAATELRSELFVYLVEAARASGVRLIAITSTDSRPVVRDLVVSRMGEERVADHTVPGLNDRQLQEVAASFPSLARLAANPRSRELLRRLVVVDLLVRSEVSDLPLSDADAMRQIWTGLVRNHGRRDRGLPDAREQVLLGLASRDLSQGSAREVAAALDASAVDGLRQDGLLRTSEGNPWQLLPDFAHEEIRRYAVARVLLADGDPGAALVEAGAPRWALGAGRLACQAVLDRPDTASAPIHGRLARLQAAFDGLVDAGHGSRWADLPAEALLTLGDPGPVLADAWSGLGGGDGTELRRLLRLIDQRHRDAAHLVDPVVVEPVVALLLQNPAPWQLSGEVAVTLREWLLALVAADTPAGHPLRILLCERLVVACDEAERQLLEREEAAAAARAERVPEAIELERERLVRQSEMISAAIGHGRRRGRERPRLPRELTDDTVLELLALLGPDLGDSGEQLLRRVARDSPRDLAPAVEELLTGKALASYGHGLLADLVEAYYLDDDEDGSGFHEDGVRDHHWRGPIAPLSAWYRGPFFALWQTDFRRGVAVLNRLLNHAARARVRTLAGIGNPWNRLSDEEIDASSAVLSITGEARVYVGDAHVWRWYRGSAVGPYPCLSALQALERFCDQLLSAGVPADRLVSILLDGCESLAMPGLIVGLLVRHLERVGSLLDPYLAEPLVWHLEFGRVVGESGGLVASSEGLVEPERRRWSLREAASWLTIQADPARAEELRAVGEQLVAHAFEMEATEAQGDEAAAEQEGSVPFTTTVRNWASTLDRDRYRAYTEGEVTIIQSAPPEDVESALRPGNEDLQRGQEATRLLYRHYAGRIGNREEREPPSAEELAGDLAAARALVEDPPLASPVGLWDMAAVAADALEAVLVRGLSLPAEGTEFAVGVVLTVAEGLPRPDGFEFAGSFFDQGADRSAARALPLLLLPEAARLRETCAREDGTSGDQRTSEAGRRLAQAVADETRLYLARGLDAVWGAPCVQGGRCHHELGLELAIESMRDCVLGDWDESGQQRRIDRLQEPVVETLGGLADNSILVSRLDAAIRATGAAVRADTCVDAQARGLLLTLLAAQRRGLLAHDHHFDERGSHALVAARALLGLAAGGEHGPLHEHVAAYADNGTALGSLLRAIAAAAEETQVAADAARSVWPAIITQVLALNRSGHHPFADGYFGLAALAALVPSPTYENAFMYWEASQPPIRWTDPLAWEAEIDAWIPVAAGESQCVDAMISLLRGLPEPEQVTFGLPRVATLARADLDAASSRSYLLAEWLKETRSAAADAGALAAWQELVDALVVAGNTTLAPYSD